MLFRQHKVRLPLEYKMILKNCTKHLIPNKRSLLVTHLFTLFKSSSFEEVKAIVAFERATFWEAQTSDLGACRCWVVKNTNSSSGVSDQQSVGWDSGRGKILYQNCFGRDIHPLVPFTRIGSARKRTQNHYHERVGVNPSVSGSHSKHHCLQVSSGLQATVTGFTYEASLVSLLEMYLSGKIRG